MINYEIKTGSKHLNIEARQNRDSIYKLKLKGMFCRKCNDDTVIKLIEDHNGFIVPQINACCSRFEKRIKNKLWS